MTRVKGHALRNEGAPFVVSETGDVVRVSAYTYVMGTAGYGRALCECGAVSPLVDSAGQRQRWHRAHKAEVST
jgi:hypothetical protein